MPNPLENDPKALMDRALSLYHNRLCPHCGKKISLWEAAAMLLGSGLTSSVKVKHVPSGKVQITALDRINPQTMVIVAPED